MSSSEDDPDAGRACPHSSGRPCFDCYFLAIADVVSRRADCRRAQHGAVITSRNRIVATGYNGSPSGGPSCLDGDCPRAHTDVPSLSSYENCIALHAEQNAIAYASRNDTEGGTIYITGKPCDMCTKLIAAAGIERIVIPT